MTMRFWTTLASALGRVVGASRAPEGRANGERAAATDILPQPRFDEHGSYLPFDTDTMELPIPAMTSDRVVRQGTPR